MYRRASFQTRARTIDHLGRGQIADAPTAVSELWKNAYDAYASKAELHVYEGSTHIAAIIDNGCGMSTDDFLNYWLVIGTESKAGSSLDHIETFGLSLRDKQGEKGIGRLSAAFLAPMTLVVTKRMDTSYTAALIDWRFFENPYLNISDVEFPIIEFNDIVELPEAILGMFATLQSNFEWDKFEDNRRATRLAGAWDSFSELEREQGEEQTTYDKIISFNPDQVITKFHLRDWRTIMKETAETENHGTALFAISPYAELDGLISHVHQDDDVQQVKENFRQILTGFTDPFADPAIEFDYAVQIHQANCPIHAFIESESYLGIDNLKSLEHWMYGEFDDRGVFKGEVQAFGKHRGEVEVYPSSIISPLSHGKIGAFKFCIGAFEGDINSSTHTPEQHATIKEQTYLYGGISVYRDGLRVMPYGREGSDLFDIEFRRSKNAGRYFFSHRRSFGRMAFTRNGNPNLKDKAGREGLVDNQTRRTMQRIVEEFLIEVADRYFGGKSPVRKTELTEIQKRNKRQAAAAKAARKRRRKSFTQTLKVNFPMISTARIEIEKNSTQFYDALKRDDTYTLANLRIEVERLDGLKENIMLPPLPSSLGKLENQYREYRDAYAEFCAFLDDLKKQISECESKGLFGDPIEVAKHKFTSNEAKLSSQINSALKMIKGHLKTIEQKWSEEALYDRKLYRKKAIDYIGLLENVEGLPRILDMLDKEYTELREDYELKYSGIYNSLDQIVEGVDIEGAFLHADQENSELERKVTQLNSVAQLGISVEIIGHELHDLESQVGKYMHKMPSNAKKLKSYKLAYEAHRALIDRLRFLTPMRLTAYRNRIEISGSEIIEYLNDFFERIIDSNRISFTASSAFEDIKIKDLPSRIYPTFINLVNNAIYWVQRGDERKICLDFQDGKVIIADTGPGVDQDDLPRLFQLFFSRRSNGRGVGLYLCKQNLAVAHHQIRYATAEDPTVYAGANFIIEFKGVESA
ncbi:MAG: histidine kinase [Desulfovibrio sp. S3730MH75]|nr:MAG: histidine kinase [Desulfovibrio sp. S3730MH75]